MKPAPLFAVIASYARAASGRAFCDQIDCKDSRLARIYFKGIRLFWDVVRSGAANIVAVHSPAWNGASLHRTCYACGRIHRTASSSWTTVGLPDGGSVNVCRPACVVNF